MRERSTVSDQGAEPGERPLSASYRLGPLIGAGRRTRIHEAPPVRPGAADGVAKTARRDLRGSLDGSLRAEGELLRRVRHPNVVKGYDVGSEPELGAYLVREKIAGVDLGTYLRREGAQTADRSRSIAIALVHAIQALEQDAHGAVGIDPNDVWIEEGTGRVVLVSVGTPDAADVESWEAPMHAVADVLVGCTRGGLAPDARERARARVEVMQARRAGASTRGIPDDLGEIIEACVARGADAEASTMDDLQRRLEGVREPDDPAQARGRAECRSCAAEIEGLLRASLDLSVPRDELRLPVDLPNLLGRAAASGTRRESWGDLQLELRTVADGLGRVLEQVAERRAGVLEAEWAEFERAAGPFVADTQVETFASAVAAVRGKVSEARFEDACRGLSNAREALAAARDSAEAVAEQHTRNEVDVLARELDELEGAYPDADPDPSLEPRRVRAEVQALVSEGRLTEALEHVKKAVESVSGERTKHQKAALHVTVQGLADRAVALRRGAPASDVAAASVALDGVERRLAEMVALLGRGELEEARTVAQEVGAELKRLDWERELAVAEPEGSPVDGLAELDEVRRMTARMQRGDDGPAVRHELEHTLDVLERATRGVWADALVRLREVFDRGAWDSLGQALGGLREQLLSAASPPRDAGFQPSHELAQVLRILAEAEREAPQASEPDASRLEALRERGEAMLARLDAKRAREIAPDLVDRLVEHCAAAADAERRGEHGRAIDELSAANAALADLLGATEGASPLPRVEDTATCPSLESSGGGVSGGRAVGGGATGPVTASPAEQAEASAVAHADSTSACGSAADTITEWARSSSVPIGWRAYFGLFLALVAVSWWTWAPTDWWRAPAPSSSGTGLLAGGVSSDLFPTIASAYPANERLPREELPQRLRVVVSPASTDTRPIVVWWLGGRVVARGGGELELANVATESLETGAPIRVTVGEGTRERQIHVWRID